MTGSRSYGQACPVAHALDLIGERWALLVVRELRLGARRYADLQLALPGVSPSVLAQRLRDLERVGVIARRTLAAPGRARVYELTEWGYGLEPVFTALARWGIRSPVVPLSGELSDDTVMLGVRTFFDSTGTPPWTARYEITLGRDTYDLSVADGELVELVRAEPPASVDCAIATSPDTMQALLTGPLDAAAAMSTGRLTCRGDAGLVERLFGAVANAR